MNVDLDGPGSAAYSPSGADGTDPNPMLLTTRSTHKHRLTDPVGDWLQYTDDTRTFTLMPPPPSVGGSVGVPSQLGWSTGLSKHRNRHQPLKGQTLVVPNMGAHPAVGPVGFSTRSQRTANGVAALGTDYTPTAAEVARSFHDHGGL